MTFQPEFKRPGLAIKAYLMANGPSTLSAIRESYVKRIKGANIDREDEGLLPLRVPSYHSFYNYFKICQQNGWVELVEYKGYPDYIPGDYHGHPDRVVFVDRTQKPPEITTGAQVGIWKLTAKGVSETDGWQNPWRYKLEHEGEETMPAVAPAPIVSKRSKKPMVQEEPEEAPESAGPDYSAIIEELKGILDEDKKAASIKKLWDRMNKYNLSEDEVVGFDDVESAINEYQDIEKSGMTPEEYRDEKSDAFETLVDAVDALEPAEEE